MASTSLPTPTVSQDLVKGHFLTKGHNACKTWDATADGYCRADGVGSVVIKKLEDAQADNDPILGVVLAAGTTTLQMPSPSPIHMQATNPIFRNSSCDKLMLTRSMPRTLSCTAPAHKLATSRRCKVFLMFMLRIQAPAAAAISLCTLAAARRISVMESLLRVRRRS